jgi:hypothetical protein
MEANNLFKSMLYSIIVIKQKDELFGTMKETDSKNVLVRAVPVAYSTTDPETGIKRKAFSGGSNGKPYITTFVEGSGEFSMISEALLAEKGENVKIVYKGKETDGVKLPTDEALLDGKFWIEATDPYYAGIKYTAGKDKGKDVILTSFRVWIPACHLNEHESKVYINKEYARIVLPNLVKATADVNDGVEA